jgi:hypothetical protein
MVSGWRSRMRLAVVTLVGLLISTVFAIDANPAAAIVKGSVVPGGWRGDEVPNPNPYAFVGRLPSIKLGGSCMASLVAPSLAVTAGHCKVSPGDEIVFGVLNWDRYSEGLEGVSQTVDEVRTQKDGLTSSSSTHLLQLDAPVWNVAPVRLAEPADKEVWSKKKPLDALGFGSIVPKCPGSPLVNSAELRQADMKIVDSAVSVGIYRGLAKLENVAQGYPNAGDSGGPLVGRDKNGDLLLIGVFQAGVGACEANYAWYYNRMWTSELQKLRKYVASHQANS